MQIRRVKEMQSLMKKQKDEKAEIEKKNLKEQMHTLEDAKKAIDKLKSKRVTRDMDFRIKKFMIDMLNLIFGKGEETDYFWNEILFKQCAE